MLKDFVELEKQIANAEVVIGIFPDLTAEDGNGTLIIKGQYRIMEIVEKQEPEETWVAIVPCDTPEEAEALRRTFGDTRII